MSFVTESSDLQMKRLPIRAQKLKYRLDVFRATNCVHMEMY